MWWQCICWFYEIAERLSPRRFFDDVFVKKIVFCVVFLGLSISIFSCGVDKDKKLRQRYARAVQQGQSLKVKCIVSDDGTEALATLIGEDSDSEISCAVALVHDEIDFGFNGIPFKGSRLQIRGSILLHKNINQVIFVNVCRLKDYFEVWANGSTIGPYQVVRFDSQTGTCSVGLLRPKKENI